jgi:hypothetical protein
MESECPVFSIRSEIIGIILVNLASNLSNGFSYGILCYDTNFHSITSCHCIHIWSRVPVACNIYSSTLDT